MIKASKELIILKVSRGTSLMVQQLGLQATKAGGRGSIPVQGTRLLHAHTKAKKKSQDSGSLWEGAYDQGGAHKLISNAGYICFFTEVVVTWVFTFIIICYIIPIGLCSFWHLGYISQ